MCPSGSMRKMIGRGIQTGISLISSNHLQVWLGTIRYLYCNHRLSPLFHLFYLHHHPFAAKVVDSRPSVLLQTLGDHNCLTRCQLQIFQNLQVCVKCGNQTREHQPGHQSFQGLRTSVFNFSNLAISDFTHSHPIVMYSEPPASMQRWQCLIHNGTLDTMFFSIMIELIVVFLDFNVFNSDISNKFSYVTYICYSVEKPCN